MRTPRIHTQQDLSEGSLLTLDPGAARHIDRVLRMEAGNPLVLFNGDGWEYPSNLESVDRKKVTVRVLERRGGIAESPLAVHLGIAISRGDRMDWVVQKATELGVREITPLFTERTEVRLASDRADKKMEHWRQVSISACEQCGRNSLPTIHELTKLAAWLTTSDAECKLVLHHRSERSVLGDTTPCEISLLVGPEGGFSEAEIRAAESAGYRSLALGPRVLRTETAPLAAIAILQARWGDMTSG